MNRVVAKINESVAGNPVLLAVLALAAMVLVGWLRGLLYGRSADVIEREIVLWALFGTFFGTILATDPCKSTRVKARPVIRTTISFVLGAVYSAVLHLSISWAVVSILAFGTLGWVGMKWIKHLGTAPQFSFDTLRAVICIATAGALLWYGFG